ASRRNVILLILSGLHETVIGRNEAVSTEPCKEIASFFAMTQDGSIRHCDRFLQNRLRCLD
ncbi:MAG: hypothetical protein LBN71_06500, partial [Tannerella sp.]|nr:hypothetical protein [Tannerella sp.]